MEKILIVEDDLILNQGLCKALKTEKRETVSCTDLEMARKRLSLGEFSLVLLDYNIDGGNGLVLLGEIKEKTPVLPVIMLIDSATDIDVLEDLEKGADDYICKPFTLAGLRVRVENQFKKKAEIVKEHLIQIDHFKFDFITLRFLVKGEMVELTKTEQKLLYQLVFNRGTVMSRTALTENIWTDKAHTIDDNSLYALIKRLRNKLDAGDYIKTVYGVGYTWVAEPERL